MANREGGGRRPYRRDTPRRRARFLRALSESGNIAEAAAETDFPRPSVYRLRRSDAAFARDIEAAIAAADARLSGLRTAPAGGEGGRDGLDPHVDPGLVIRRGRGGRTQLVAAGTHWWSVKDDARFLGHLAATGNAKASARAAGFSAKAAQDRRRRWPGFARAWEEAMQDAEIRLEYRLVSGALNGFGEAAPDHDSFEEAEPFDPWLAMWILKYRDGRRAGTWRVQSPRPVPFEEVCESISRKIDAIERHEQRFGGASEEERQIDP